MIETRWHTNIGCGTFAAPYMQYALTVSCYTDGVWDMAICMNESVGMDMASMNARFCGGTIVTLHAISYTLERITRHHRWTCRVNTARDAYLSRASIVGHAIKGDVGAKRRYIAAKYIPVAQSFTYCRLVLPVIVDGDMLYVP
jgi:hypothetical protein